MTNEIFKNICKMQEELGSLINPRWKSSNLNFRLAASQEMSELIDYYPWKWWKKDNKPFALYQAQLEVVDIAHFLISDMIIVFEKPELAASLLSDAYPHTNTRLKSKHAQIGDNDFIKELFLQHRKILTASSTHCGEIICDLMSLHNIDLPLLNKIYLSKNSLNIFRLKNGYQDGTYIKEWRNPNGEGTIEDNAYLESIVGQVPDWQAPNVGVNLYHSLKTGYEKYAKGQ